MALIRSRTEHFARAYRRAAFGAPALWRMLLLLAFVAQGCLVQAHVHFAQPGVTGASTAQAAKGLPGKLEGHAPAEPSKDCPLCQEMAMAGHYYLPAADVVSPPLPMPVWVAIAAEAAFFLTLPAHFWLSRAPPQ